MFRKSPNKEVLNAQCLAYALVKERNWLDCRVNIQGIMHSTETETFAKEPKLVQLLRELKSPPALCNKKVYWFFLYVCSAKFAAF